MSVEVRNGKLYYKDWKEDYEVTLAKGHRSILELKAVDPLVPSYIDTKIRQYLYSLDSKGVMNTILVHRDELNADIVALAEEQVEKDIRYKEAHRQSYLNQMDDWRDTERKILAEAHNEKYRQYELIDETWKGDRKVLKTYSMPGMHFDSYRQEVDVLYEYGEKVEETYYVIEDMRREYDYGYFDNDIDVNSLDPRRLEKIFKYKNGDLVEYIDSQEERYDGINEFRFGGSEYKSFFQNGKLVRVENSAEVGKIDTIYTLEENKLEMIDINRDWETDYITSETKTIMHFYNQSSIKELSIYEDKKLVFQMEFNTSGSETKRAVYDEEWKDYLPY